MVEIALVAVSLALGPYAGPPLSGSVPKTTKFAVTVRGRPHATVRLRAVDIPAGYIASFCTQTVCSRTRVELELPSSGRQTIELQFIADLPTAVAPRIVTVVADERVRASIAFARGTRR